MTYFLSWGGNRCNFKILWRNLRISLFSILRQWNLPTWYDVCLTYKLLHYTLWNDLLFLSRSHGQLKLTSEHLFYVRKYTPDHLLTYDDLLCQVNGYMYTVAVTVLFVQGEITHFFSNSVLPHSSQSPFDIYLQNFYHAFAFPSSYNFRKQFCDFCLTPRSRGQRLITFKFFLTSKNNTPIELTVIKIFHNKTGFPNVAVLMT